jgi:hypothetical protein
MLDETHVEEDVCGGRPTDIIMRLSTLGNKVGSDVGKGKFHHSKIDDRLRERA